MARIVKDPDIRRQEIIDGARQLFEKQGISRTSMSGIARQLDVAKGLLYYYFDSKEALVATVIDQLTRQFSDGLTRIAERTDMPFHEKLKMILRFYFTTIKSHPGILSLDLSHPDLFALVRSRLSDVAYLQVRTVLQSGLDSGDIAIAYPDLVLRILINGLADLYMEGTRQMDVHAALIEQILGLEKGSLH